MPTVHRQAGFRIVIYTNDHQPAHVHVLKGGGEAKFALSLAGEDIQLLMVVGLSAREIKEAGEMVAANNDRLLEEWRRIHG